MAKITLVIKETRMKIPGSFFAQIRFHSKLTGVTNDTETTLSDLRARVAEFVNARNWQPFHNPKNLAMSIAIEAAEIQEHFQWLTIEESREYARSLENRLDVADELADVIIYCLSFANATEIDVTNAVLKKLARNEYRFPRPETP